MQKFKFTKKVYTPKLEQEIRSKLGIKLAKRSPSEVPDGYINTRGDEVEVVITNPNITVSEADLKAIIDAYVYEIPKRYIVRKTLTLSTGKVIPIFQSPSVELTNTEITHLKNLGYEVEEVI